MDISTVKEDLFKYVGKEVTIKYNLGRNKHEVYNVIIKELFDNIFLVEKSKTQEIRTFSYNDLISKTIKIDFRD